MRTRRRVVAVAALAPLLALVLGCAAEPVPRPTITVTVTPGRPSADPSAGTPSPTSEPTPSGRMTPGTGSPDRDQIGPGDVLARPVWVHLFDDSLKTRAGIRRVVADLVAAGATAVIVEVVRRHDAYYDSDVLARTADPKLAPGLDVLAAMVEEGHAAGLEVHAWIPVAPTWHAYYEDLPAPAGWLTTEHGRSAPVADRWVTRTVDGKWEQYLDFGLPEVRAHVAAVVGELARYDVDGIHLDYIRYASNEQGYHPRALAAFQAETGFSGVPTPADSTWSQWRRDQVTATVIGARNAIRAAGSDAVLSAAVISWGNGPSGGATSFRSSQAYSNVLQDWQGWAERGLVDVLLPMNYFREYKADQARWFRAWLAFEDDLSERTGVPVVPALACYLNSPDDALTQLGLATLKLGGAGVFSYQQSTSEVGVPLWADLAASDWGTR